jgi:hypothetical protein
VQNPKPGHFKLFEFFDHTTYQKMLRPGMGTQKNQKGIGSRPCAVYLRLYFVTNSLRTAFCADRFSDPMAIHSLVC